MADLDGFEARCGVCNNFQNDRPFVRGHVQYPRGEEEEDVEYSGWKRLLASAESCYRCKILVVGVRGCFKQHGLEELDIVDCTLFLWYNTDSFEAMGNQALRQKTLTFELIDRETNVEREIAIEFFPLDDSDHPVPASWGYFLPSGRVSRRLESSEIPFNVKSWLRRCSQEHENSFCKAATAPSDLPTRIVDVGPDNDSVKLVETNRMRDSYLCLSHCWGKSPIITTTKANIAEHKRGIPWNRLSKTFQDAVVFTRALGKRFIWIDSLCIVQDDLSDWEIESAKMASVYSNCYLTLAATRSADGNGGLFFDAHDVEVSGVTPLNEPYRLFFRECVTHRTTTELWHYDVYQDFHPLLDRAWVYQERMLSPRVLHFGEYELFYECRSDAWCDCGAIKYHAQQDNYVFPLIKVEYAKAVQRLANLEKKNPHPALLMEVAYLWRTMVKAYTNQLLTKEKDRLPALGGLARQMASARGSKYLAGLWADTINEDLLWSGGRWLPRPSPRTAPTWSWASTPGRIDFWDGFHASEPSWSWAGTNERAGYRDDSGSRKNPFEHLATVEAVSTTPSGLNEYGTIALGTLTITGLLATGWFQYGLQHTKLMCLPTGSWIFMPDYDLEHEGVNRVEPGSSIHCLRMSLGEAGDGRRYLYSLVLRASPENSGVYERIGILEALAHGRHFETNTYSYRAPVGDLYCDADMRTVTIV